MSGTPPYTPPAPAFTGTQDTAPAAVAPAPAPVAEVAPSAAAPLAQPEATAPASSQTPKGDTGSESPTESLSSASAAPTIPAAPKPANEFQPSLLEGATTESVPATDGNTATADAVAPSEAPGETPLAPVKYEFTYPEGFDSSKLNSERMSAYTGILGEAKVSPEAGQKLLDMHLQEINTAAERIAQHQWDVFNETQNRWRSEAQADPEIGGDKFAHSIRTIMALVDQFGGNAQERAALLDAMKITGAGNNPAMLRFMHRAAQGLSREAVPTPAPPPRMPQTQGRERGLSRYRESTPYKG